MVTKRKPRNKAKTQKKGKTGKPKNKPKKGKPTTLPKNKQKKIKEKQPPSPEKIGPLHLTRKEASQKEYLIIEKVWWRERLHDKYVEKAREFEAAGKDKEAAIMWMRAANILKQIANLYRQKILEILEENEKLREEMLELEDKIKEYEAKVRELEAQAWELENANKGTPTQEQLDEALELWRDADLAKFEAIQCADRIDEIWDHLQLEKETLSNLWEKATDLLEKSFEHLYYEANELELALRCIMLSIWMIDPSALRPWLRDLPESAEDFERRAKQGEKASERKELAADLQEELGNDEEADKLREEAEKDKKQAKEDYEKAAEMYKGDGNDEKAQEMSDIADYLSAL